MRRILTMNNSTRSQSMIVSCATANLKWKQFPRSVTERILLSGEDSPTQSQSTRSCTMICNGVVECCKAFCLTSDCFGIDFSGNLGREFPAFTSACCYSPALLLKFCGSLQRGERGNLINNGYM